MRNFHNTTFTYSEDIDPVSGAPTIVAITSATKAAQSKTAYQPITDIGDLFRRENLREAWRILRKNDPFDYQLRIADAILYSALQGLGWFFVVMISRQAGKNEISAFIQQYILLYGWYYGKKVSGVKFAPVYKPQVQASMDRLKGAATPDSGGLAGSLATRHLWRKSDGYKFHVGEPREGNQWAFLSINPTADVASQTAFTLLEGDEVQDIDANKWERDAQPMAAFNNATTVFWGVAWTKESFVYTAMKQAHAMEQRLEAELGYRPQLVFKIDANAVIASGNQNYKKAFENQLSRLGPNHIAIQTQYLLQFVDSIGRFFDPQHMEKMLSSDFQMQQVPKQAKIYVFALDVAGQEENQTSVEENVGQHARDATSLIIGELLRDGTVYPVALYQWVGEAHTKQRQQILALLKNWRVVGGSVDATGIGEPLAYWLIEKLPNAEIEAYKFKASGDENKSKLGYLAYSYVRSEQIKIPERPVFDGQQAELWDELVWQLENLVRIAKKEQKINFHVPANAKPRREGHVPHDDLATAFFLLMRAVFMLEDPQGRKVKAFDRGDVF